VELLVVIGIIAVLIGILLPTLQKARRQAYLTQCSSNMRQIAIGMLTYIQDNKYRFPPSSTSKAIAGPFPRGWWWPNELVRGGYIKNKNCNAYPVAGGPKILNSMNVFKCPEGIDESFDAGSLPAPQRPIDASNN